MCIRCGAGEWLLTFWKYHLDARNDPDPAKRPLEVILHPGEVIFVPHGYWHMVVNLEESLALTHNYVSTSNLSDCLRFLREKLDQISGVRDRGGEAIQPEQLYPTFLKALGTILPAATLQEHVEASLLPAKSNLSETEKGRLLLQRTTKRLKRKRGLGTLGVADPDPVRSLDDRKSEGLKSPKQIDSIDSVKSSFSFGFMV